jgi:hypothetical protein
MTKTVFAIAGMGLLLACDETPPERRIAGIAGPSFMKAEWSEWSGPVHLDAPVNSACQDQTPTLSKDELSLYFTSTRRGGLGNDTPDGCQDTFDLWVARRDSRDRPWAAAVNLGSPVNTSASEAGPEVSPDGRLLFFYRFQGPGAQRDIYVARRDHDTDDEPWSVPVSLGPDVNTAVDEEGPSYVHHEGDGDGTLYFDRGSPPAATDLYAVRINKDGETLGPAALVPGLSSTVEDNHSSVRRDGREIFFNSRRPGSTLGANGLPSFDIWVATRKNVHDAWSTPVNVGAPVNSQFAEFHANISVDGRTLLFIAPVARGGLGGFDIWMVTRTQGNN